MEFDREELIQIDGSYGEGGGQILRTALAFSGILKQPLQVYQIRAARKNPGLLPQHLMAVESLAKVTEARTEGMRIGSETITFIPDDIIPGDYRFDVRTAGSVTLLLQALMLPLCFAHGNTRLTLIGGSHVPWSPPFHYLQEVLLPILRSMGIFIESTLERWGWYPKGGGILHLEIKPIKELKSLSLINRGKLKKIRGVSATSHLPKHVGERQKDEALRRLIKELNMDAEIEVFCDVPANGPGSFFFLVAESEGAIAGFSSLGKRGKKAEDVAKEAVDSLKDYVESDGCIDPHLADQLVPFMSLAKGNSSFTTTKMTEHLLTNLWVVQHFLKTKISKSGEKGKKGRIEFLNK
jgi:RNA 3'-terminal phosphate cyclase (ATP)